MKILVDARFLGPEGTGIGKYVGKLLENLEKIDQENHYYILLRKSNFDLWKTQNPNFQKILADAKWYSIKEQLLIPRIISKIKPDLVHFPHYNVPIFFSGRFVVTVYDLTKWEFGREASNVRNSFIFFLKQGLFKLMLRKAVGDSTRIISGSDTTKIKLISLLGVPENKIQTIYAGADDFLNTETKMERNKTLMKRLKIKKPFVLYVGNAAPYKNVEIILSVLKVLKDLTFVYVSSRDVFVEGLVREAQRLGVSDRVIATGYITDHELAILYKEALCYIFPSLSEGFGLPGLEAMASSCPVVCSNIPVLQEIYADAAAYFDPKNSSDLVEQVEKVRLNENFRQDLIKKAHIQVRKYSWEKLAAETLKIYQETSSL